MKTDKLKYPIGKYNPGKISMDKLEEWIDGIEKFPSLLRKTVKGLNEKELLKTYRPEGWNIRQLVHHLADSHMNSFIRFKLALTEDCPTIKPYEESNWATFPDANKQPIESSLLILEGLHSRWTTLLKNMSVTDFSKSFLHPEHKISTDLASTVGMYEWHGKHHLEHIKIAKKS
ncbi:MAG: putative metal-dependent hydrolase [Saprospiraceae bacterium]